MKYTIIIIFYVFEKRVIPVRLVYIDLQVAIYVILQGFESISSSDKAFKQLSI